MKNCSLSTFLDFLNSLSQKDFRSDAVDHFLGTHRVSEADYLPFIFFRADTYGRNLVYKTELFELLTLTWLPGQRTPIHDHASNRCWSVVHTGSLTTKNFDYPKTETFDLKPQGNCEVQNVGNAVYIDDSMGIHSITNASTKPAVSIHLYAGPMERCRIYNEQKKRLEWSECVYYSCPEIFRNDAAPTKENE